MTWVWCVITEDEGEEPDWSLVPEGRREMVRSRWKPKRTSSRWKLWETQVDHYRIFADVEVLGPVSLAS